MLSRGIAPSLDGALFRHTTRAFQKQLLTLSPTQPADGTSILCHCSTSSYRTSPRGCAQQFSCIRPSRDTTLDATPLRWTAPVVRNRGNITDHMDPQSSGLKRSNRRFTTGPRPIHIDIHLTHSTLHRLACSSLASPLSRKGRALSRALEALVSRACPHNRVAAHVGDGDDRV